jgi:hypothetical protein
MKTNFGAYIFSNNDDSDPNNSFVGITFGDDVSDEQIEFFEDVLSNYGVLIHQNESSEAIDSKMPYGYHEAKSSARVFPNYKETEEDKIPLEAKSNKNSAETLARQILNGAEYFSKGLGKTTEYATKYMQKGSEHIKSRLDPNPEPTKVSPMVQSLVKNVRKGTTKPVKVSSFVTDKLSDIATSATRKVTPHLKSGSKTLLTKSKLVSNENTSKQYVDNVFMVTGSTVKSFGIVVDSLEQAAKTLANNLTDQSIKVVDYK